MRRRFSEAEILGFLRQAAAGTPVLDLCWNHCIPRSTFYAWKAKYGAATDGERESSQPASPSEPSSPFGPSFASSAPASQNPQL
jgi:hypothetical protein